MQEPTTLWENEAKKTKRLAALKARRNKMTAIVEWLDEQPTAVASGSVCVVQRPGVAPCTLAVRNQADDARLAPR